MITLVTRFLLIALLALPLGCEHELETSCPIGDCTDYEPTPGEVKLGECLEMCDTTVASDQTGEYPCAVQAIMDDICTNCHSDPTQNGAPFPLAAYEDSLGLSGSSVIYAKIVGAVGLAQDPIDFMPLGGPPLDDEQRTAMIDDWACVCAPPRPDDETCE